MSGFNDSMDEIKIAFELAYIPIAQMRQRLNGQDFLGVAVPLLDSVREQIGDDEDIIRKAAQTMVSSFNEMLNPKLSLQNQEEMVDLLVNNGSLTRAVANQNIEENKLFSEKMKHNMGL